MLWPTIKKYATYVAVVIVGILVVVGCVFFNGRRKEDDGALTQGTELLKGVVAEIGQKMDDANQQAAVEIVAARTEDASVKAQLSEVIKINDKAERRQKLSDLYKQVGG
jgi:thiamine biosynthesis lipoprotein ApbE